VHPSDGPSAMLREAEELGESQFLLSCRQCDLPLGHCSIQRLEPLCAGWTESLEIPFSVLFTTG